MTTVRAVLRPAQDERAVTTPTQLMRVLDEARDTARRTCGIALIDLIADGGRSLSVAVGGEESVLCFCIDGDRDAAISRGVSRSESPVLTAYYFFDHHSEYPRSAVIPMTDAIIAAMEFLTSGERPTTVRWQGL